MFVSESAECRHIIRQIEREHPNFCLSLLYDRFRRQSSTLRRLLWLRRSGDGKMGTERFLLWQIRVEKAEIWFGLGAGTGSVWIHPKMVSGPSREQPMLSRVPLRRMDGSTLALTRISICALSKNIVSASGSSGRSCSDCCGIGQDGRFPGNCVT